MSAVNRRPTLFVTGFPPEVRAKDLAYQFEKYGEIVRCDVPAPAPGRITRYAFIEYIDENDASKALSRLDGETYEGKKLIVEWAKRTPEEPIRILGVVVTVIEGTATIEMACMGRGIHEAKENGILLVERKETDLGLPNALATQIVHTMIVAGVTRTARMIVRLGMVGEAAIIHTLILEMGECLQGSGTVDGQRGMQLHHLPEALLAEVPAMATIDADAIDPPYLDIIRDDSIRTQRYEMISQINKQDTKSLQLLRLATLNDSGSIISWFGRGTHAFYHVTNHPHSHRSLGALSTWKSHTSIASTKTINHISPR
ncbi:hypothetical protein FRC19_003929 [Serendipita sp. 401]|nr:hypothetical protein FRC19_003929 [Serendipita sp. 401]